MKHTIEGSNLFSLLAWTAIIGFAFFTYTIAKELKENEHSLSARTSANEEALKSM